MIKDVVFLVADKDMEQVLLGLLTRRLRSLRIRAITFDVFVHFQRDAGCYNDAHNFLRSYINQYRYAIILFDHHGCGQESVSSEELQEKTEKELEKNGWNDRVKVIIIRPELEIWVWSDSPRVDECLGWSGYDPDLRSWLREQELLASDAIKPENPKYAVEQALRAVRKPRSAALFRQLAESVSLQRCVDPSFALLKLTLHNWFSSDS